MSHCGQEYMCVKSCLCTGGAKAFEDDLEEVAWAGQDAECCGHMRIWLGYESV